MIKLQTHIQIDSCGTHFDDQTFCIFHNGCINKIILKIGLKGLTLN